MGLIKDRFLGGAEREAGRIQARAAREAQFQNLIATREAVEALRQQFPGAESAINEAFAQQLGFLGAGQEQALGNILGFGQEAGRAVGRGGAQARQDIAGGFGFGQQQLDPFAQAGRQAQELQLAQSGALGPEAQQQAFDQFIDSPGQQFLREQGERAVQRSAAARGGAGGGAVLAELQRQGQGLAAQDFNRQFERLGGIAGRGLGAAGQLGQLGAQAGRALGDVATGTATQQANLLSNLGTNLGGLFTQQAANLANLAGGRGTQLANLRQQLGTTLANALIGQGTQLGGLEQDVGAARASGILGQAAQLRAFEEQQFQRFQQIFGGFMGGGIGG